MQHRINQIDFTTVINTVLERAPSLGIFISGPLCEVVQVWFSAWLRTMLYCYSFHMTSALGPRWAGYGKLTQSSVAGKVFWVSLGWASNHTHPHFFS